MSGDFHALGIPRRARGRQTAEKRAQYMDELKAFTSNILQINSTLDFKVSSRGWSYILEEHGLLKGDFDLAQRLVNDCRKSGMLPLDITAVDGNRLAEGVQDISLETPEEFAQRVVDSIADEALWYTPKAFWEYQDCYVEMMVEKIDLKSLFEPVCWEYHIPITNARGWSDIHSRAAMMERFAEWEAEGKECVLLYCGDHDPGGLCISDTIRSNFNDLSGATGWSADDLIIDRFGLNYDFIQANNLSWVNNLETSSGGRLDNPKHTDHGKPYVQSYLTQYGVRKVEANALVTRPQAGRQLCREAILKYVDAAAAEDYESFIAEQQEAVRSNIMELMQGAG